MESCRSDVPSGPHSPVRILRLSSGLAGLAIGSVAGCGSDSTAPNVEALGGVYSLTSINGQPLPFLWLFEDADNQVSFVSGIVTLNADLSFVDETEFSVTEDGQTRTDQLVASGAWSLEENIVTFSAEGGETYTMTWNGSNRLTQNFQGLILVYERSAP